jgi:hypothetical protein
MQPIPRDILMRFNAVSKQQTVPSRKHLSPDAKSDHVKKVASLPRFF